MPVVDFEKARRKRSRKRAIKRFSIMAAICGLILVAFAMKNLLSGVPVWGMLKSNFTLMGKNTNFPISLPENKYYGLDKINNNLLIKSETNLIVMDNSGNEVLKTAHGQNDPIYKVVGNDILYYTTNSKYVTIQSIYGSSRRVDVENTIVDAELSKDGSVAIAGYSSSNSSVVEIYKPGQEKWVFRWHDSSYIVTHVTFTPDLKGVLLTMIDTRDGIFHSKIQRYNLSSKDIVFEIEVEGTLIHSVQYHGNNNIIAVGDNKSIVFDTNGKMLSEYDYNSKPLQDFNNTEQNGVVLLFSNYGANEDSSIVVLDNEFKVLMAIDSSQKINSMYVSKNTEYLMTDSELKWYNNKGNLLGTMSIPENTTYFKVIDNYGYFLAVDNIEKLPIKSSGDNNNKTSSVSSSTTSTDEPTSSDTISSISSNTPSSSDK